MNTLSAEWVEKAEGDFYSQRDLLVVLDRYAVLYRYPGISADKAEASRVIKSLRIFRQFIRHLLGFSESMKE